MINELVNLLKSSVEKSVNLKFFKTKEDAAFAHLNNIKMEKIQLSKFKNGTIKNFQSDRLKGKTEEKAYPEDNRPKGDYNIESVKFHRELITQEKYPLIFVLYKNSNYYLIQGSHKIIAAHLEKLKTIDAYVVYV